MEIRVALNQRHDEDRIRALRSKNNQPISEKEKAWRKECVERARTGLLAQLAERRAWYHNVLGSNPTFSTKHITCLSPAVGGLK